MFATECGPSLSLSRQTECLPPSMNHTCRNGHFTCVLRFCPMENMLVYMFLSGAIGRHDNCKNDDDNCPMHGYETLRDKRKSGNCPLPRRKQANSGPLHGNSNKFHLIYCACVCERGACVCKLCVYFVTKLVIGILFGNLLVLFFSIGMKETSTLCAHAHSPYTQYGATYTGKTYTCVSAHSERNGRCEENKERKNANNPLVSGLLCEMCFVLLPHHGPHLSARIWRDFRNLLNLCQIGQL